MRKLLLVALCSTSLLSVVRAEDTFGSRNALGDAMKASDDAGRAGSMAPDPTQAHRKTAKKAKKAKKQGADTPMKHDGMEGMKHDGMDHGSMEHDGQMDSGTK